MCTLSLIVMEAFEHINLLFICSWNQPLLRNEGNISCSLEGRALIVLKPAPNKQSTDHKSYHTNHWAPLLKLIKSKVYCNQSLIPNVDMWDGNVVRQTCWFSLGFLVSIHTKTTWVQTSIPTRMVCIRWPFVELCNHY